MKVVVLTGAGERAFTAGPVDLKELSTDPAGHGRGQRRRTRRRVPRAPSRPARSPSWALISGVAITGGFEVALACDVLICSTNARFADTHAPVGITPGWGLSAEAFSRAIGPYRAKELSLTGNFRAPSRPMTGSLVNRVVEPADLMPTAPEAGPTRWRPLEADMLVTYKAMIDDGYARSAMGGGLALEHERSVGDRPQRRRDAADGRGAPGGGAGAGPAQ